MAAAFAKFISLDDICYASKRWAALNASMLTKAAVRRT
jgi:hypothetical protein